MANVATSTWVALLRGINVGGRHRLPMSALVEIMKGQGLTDIKTYIQSGNAVFDGPARASSSSGADLADAIADGIADAHGFKPRVLILSAAQLASAIAANPFPEAEGEPKQLHLYFLAAAPTAPDLASLEQLKTPTERFHCTDQVFYLHVPDGLGRSKLAAAVERRLGVPATARNWRTVKKLEELVLARAE
ncbi:MAG: DUF1697 domain-containing protein [Haliangiales bacterium]